jgi:hypothetical protein
MGRAHLIAGLRAGGIAACQENLTRAAPAAPVLELIEHEAVQRVRVKRNEMEWVPPHRVRQVIDRDDVAANGQCAQQRGASSQAQQVIGRDRGNAYLQTRPLSMHALIATHPPEHAHMPLEGQQ